MTCASTILHLSDLHFGAEIWNSVDRFDLASYFVKHVKALDTKPLIVISGDVTFQGSPKGFETASRFFEEIIVQAGVDRNRLIVCPGNHDIRKDGTGFFFNFDAFSSQLRRDQKFTFSKNSALFFKIEPIEFLVFNSAYHGNHQYGLIDIGAAERALNSVDPSDGRCLRIAISHHHLLGLVEQDVSATRNAYKLIELLSRYNFSALLHGHQHFNLTLSAGSVPLKVLGVRSLNFVTPGIVNGFNQYAICDGEIKTTRYALLKDPSNGRPAGFTPFGHTEG